jgi:hypothetical protein
MLWKDISKKWKVLKVQPNKLWFPVLVFCLVIGRTTTANAQLRSVGVIGDPVPREVEEMTRDALDFLQKTQSEQGIWSGNHFGSEPGVVGLCVLAMLACGEDPVSGPYSLSIKRGLNFILESANTQNGYIGLSMYNHGFATLALAEAYGAVPDDRIGPALEKAVALILTSQKMNAAGAWRYGPESSDADTTASGACMMALYAARNAGVAVPKDAIEKALEFYVSCQTPDGGFGYVNGSNPNAPRTAIGTLVLALQPKFNPEALREAAVATVRFGYDTGNYYFYYLYYASQAFFRIDPDEWRKWNKSNISALKKIQSNGAWNGRHGPTFSTAAAVLSLALNYRYLPIYER